MAEAQREFVFVVNDKGRESRAPVVVKGNSTTAGRVVTAGLGGGTGVVIGTWEDCRAGMAFGPVRQNLPQGKTPRPHRDSAGPTALLHPCEGQGLGPGIS